MRYIKDNILAIVGFTVIILFIVYSNYLTTKEQDYTIGVIVSTYDPVGSGPRANFSYVINGATETQGVYLEHHKVQIGKRFIVEFPKENPSWGIILLDYPVPDGIEAPPEGWDKMPVFNK